MFLKDPDYKPRPKEVVKLNPFAALTQLRGVKKIIGTNASSYQLGLGDLFSSCFEMSSSFLGSNLSDESGHARGNIYDQFDLKFKCKHVKRSKSLPNIFDDGQKDDFLATSIENLSTEKPKYASNKIFFNTTTTTTNTKKQGYNNETDVCNGSLNTSTIDDKSKVVPLQVPKFIRSSLSVDERTLSSDVGVRAAIINNSSDINGILTRRESSESGFFSSVNDEYDNNNINFLRLCNCCVIQPSFLREKSIARTSDLSSETSSLRSFDDLDLSSTRKKYRQVDIDATSFDLNMINRMTIDTEINTLIQKHQLSNQFFHCKNRTSSIYSDSSDSLAGSDSLLWDCELDRTHQIPSTRSAQIAKIVEYFERKGTNFKASLPKYNVPEANLSSSACFATTTDTSAQSYVPTTNYNHHKQLADYFVDLRRDFDGLNYNDNGIDNSRFKWHTGQCNYDPFYFDLPENKKKTQNFHKICEGLVKSKLKLFDKLNESK
jgi:hypothetical protein